MRLPFLLLTMVLVMPVHAARKSDFGGQHISGNGRSISVHPQAVQNSSFIPGTRPNHSGWYPAGNYGVAPPATGPTMTLGTTGDVYFAGTKYPFQAAYVLPKATLWNAAKALSGGYLGLGIFTLTSMVEWLANANVKLEDGHWYVPNPSACKANCFSYRFSGTNISAPTLQEACRQLIALAQASNPSAVMTFTGVDTSSNRCLYNARYPNGYIDYRWPDAYTVSRPPDTQTHLPASLDDIAPYMDTPDVPQQVVQDLLDRGADIPLPNPTLTGPSSITGPQKVTQHPDGTKTVTTTVQNFSIVNNTINNTSNVITTQRFDQANKLISQEAQTETPAEQQDTPPVDTPLPAIAKLYEPIYPGGLAGIWQSRKAEILDTSLFRVIPALTPNLGDGGCPQWAIPSIYGGSLNASLPCNVWFFIRLVIIISSLLLARRLIFGG